MTPDSISINDAEMAITADVDPGIKDEFVRKAKAVAFRAALQEVMDDHNIVKVKAKRKVNRWKQK